MNAKLVGSLVVALGLSVGIAGAQTAPLMPAGPQRAAIRRPVFSAAMPLRLAYRAIGMAEARGAGGRYLDAARTHYRSALARFQRDDRQGAAAEALAAASLARAALDERPLPAPRDVPAPPALPTPSATSARPGLGARPAPGPGPRQRFVVIRRGFGGRRRPGRGAMHFDPAALARDAALENTAEATAFARSAVDADVARERALFAGNHDEAQRDGRLARDLARAVHALAMADHPQAFAPQRMMRRPLGGRGGVGPSNGLRPQFPPPAAAPGGPDGSGT